jgi:hypothetical protein
MSMRFEVCGMPYSTATPPIHQFEAFLEAQPTDVERLGVDRHVHTLHPQRPALKGTGHARRALEV